MAAEEEAVSGALRRAFRRLDDQARRGRGARGGGREGGAGPFRLHSSPGPAALTAEPASLAAAQILAEARADGGRDGATALVLLRLADTFYAAHAGGAGERAGRSRPWRPGGGVIQ
jgi:hypothetical protein